MDPGRAAHGRLTGWKPSKFRDGSTCHSPSKELPELTGDFSWLSHGFPMAFPWRFPWRFPWLSHGVSHGVSHGFPMGFSWLSRGVSHGFQAIDAMIAEQLRTKPDALHVFDSAAVEAGTAT